MRGMLERLCSAGYQFCVVDGRGEYLDFEPAVVFGTPDHKPDTLEIFTALEKPDVQAVVCLAAVPPRERPAFFESFLVGLKALREKTGRPHWLVVDEAQELLPRTELEREAAPAQNTVYVTQDPANVSPAILAHVGAVIACGADAKQAMDKFAAVLGEKAPAQASREPVEGEALAWFHRAEPAPRLVAFMPGTTRRRAIREDVGRLLRRA
jgi:hypothetical protein